MCRPLLRRVPAGEATNVVEKLVEGWLERRADGETFQQFTRRASDEELIALAGEAVRATSGSRRA